MKSRFSFFILFICLMNSCSLGKDPLVSESQSGWVSQKNESEIRIEIPVPQTPEQALDDFYSYLNAGKYAEAYFLWDDAGKASGYDYSTFEKWYKSLASSSYSVTGEKILRNTLGIISVEIPVKVTLQKKDASLLSYTGHYTFIQNGTGETLSTENSYWLIFDSQLEAEKK